MIQGFETQTHDLTEIELRLIPGFIAGLRKRTSADKAVTAAEITASYKKNGFKLSGPRVRKIIHHIRTTRKDFVVVASSKGYWVTTNPDDIWPQIASLTHRANSQLEVAKHMRNFIENLEVSN